MSKEPTAEEHAAIVAGQTLRVSAQPLLALIEGKKQGAYGLMLAHYRAGDRDALWSAVSQLAAYDSITDEIKQNLTRTEKLQEKYYGR